MMWIRICCTVDPDPGSKKSAWKKEEKIHTKFTWKIFKEVFLIFSDFNSINYLKILLNLINILKNVLPSNLT